MRRSLHKIFQKQVRVISKFSLKKKLLISSATLSLFLFIVGLSLFQTQSVSPSPQTSLSSELNIADSSPLGADFGLVVPASCPSDLHDDPNYGTACTSSANNCGATNSGTFQCGGTCSVSAPASCSGWISASANPCTVASGASLCSSTVSWGTSNTPSATVIIDGLTFGSGTSGSNVAPWISGDPNYGALFSLRGSNGTTLGQVTVRGTCVSGTSWVGGKCMPPLSPPPSFTASCSYNAATARYSITTSWGTVSGATSYPIRLDHPGSTPANTIVGNPPGDSNAPTGTSYTFSGLTTPGTYSTWVHAWNSVNGWSPQSTRSVDCIAPPLPAPSNFTASCSYNAATARYSIATSWSAVSGATNYPIRLDHPGSTPANTIVGNGAVGDGAPTGTSYTFSSLTTPGDYSTWVHAWNSTAGWSPQSTRSVTCDPPTPASCTYNGTVTWSPCSGPYSGTIASGSSATVPNTASGYNGSATYTCTNGTWSLGSSTCTAVAATTVNGVCSSTAETCTQGTYSNSPADTAGTTFNWTCLGTGTPRGTDDSCSAAMPVPVTTFTGTYSTQTNQTTLNLPSGGGSVNLNWSITNGAGGGSCTGYSTTGVSGWSTTGTGGKSTTGTNVPVNVSATTTFSLDCWNGNGTAATRRSVTVNVASASTTVNGVCSSTAETCTQGTYSNSPADTAANYQWTCLGSGSPVGTNSGTCTAPKPTTVNGVCSSSAETCTSGTYSNSPADTAANYQWTCLGSGTPTGTNSGTCTAPIGTTCTARTQTSTVTGSTSGAVWGTNTYTDDSAVGTAAVHAGLISSGQTASIRQTFGGTAISNYVGSTQNGVTSSSWSTPWCPMTLSLVASTTVNGVCGGSANTCSAGTYSSSPADTATTYNWTCSGTGTPTGANASCSAPIPVATPTVNLGASPGSIAAGASSTLTWTTSSDVTSCWATNGGAGWTNTWKSNGGGTQVVTPTTSTTTYTIECWDGGGVSTGPDSVTVRTNNPDTNFRGTYGTQTNRSSLDLPAGGGTVNLNWSVDNTLGGSCTGYSTTGISGWSTTGTGGKSITGSNVPVTVSTTTRFDLDCWNSYGTAANRRSVTVNVPASTTVNGVCSATAETCTTGTYSNSPADTAGTTYNWTCLGSGTPTGTNASCSAPMPVPVTTFTGTYSTQTNQTTINLPSSGGNVTLNWSITNQAGGGSCTGYGSGFAGGGKAVPGSQVVNVSSTTTFSLDCWNGNGTAAVRRSVTVNVAATPTFTICPASGVALRQGDTYNALTAWYSAAGGTINCSSTGGATNVTASSSWSTLTPSVVSMNGPGSITARNTGSTTTASGTIRATYSGLSDTIPISVAANCTSNCAATAATQCDGTSYTTSNSCGISETCTGTRSCDYNWTEVAP